jgi:nitrite reductase (NADH) large subunit
VTDTRRLVVIGNGMAGARFVEELLARGAGARYRIAMFGEEPCGNYNRILLSSVLARSHDPRDIFINPLPWYEANGVSLHAGVRVTRINLSGKQVVAGEGIREAFDDLVIATGSTPNIPPIEGLAARVKSGRQLGRASLKRGVFVFRTLSDCDRMLAFISRARRAVVIGGGLLGLEAARGLLNAGLEVHVAHLPSHLMETQLDADGGRVLRKQLEQMGLHVRVGATTTAVCGDDEVAGVRFADGAMLDCQMVVLAAGIQPNVALAVKAGLRVNRGIVVGDDLACAGVSDVYAIGECAEHRGTVYGLVAPAWEQAQVLAERLSGRRPHAQYGGSKPSTKLKVAGIDLAVMGEKDAAKDDDEVVSYSEPTRGIYKKLIVRRDRLVGAIVLGDGVVVPSLLRAYTESAGIPENRAEMMFPARADTPALPQHVPDTALICNCNSVTKAQIVECVLGGARSLRAVCNATRATTGCGSCRPEVQSIVDLACQGLTEPTVLASAVEAAPTVTPPPDAELAVMLNKNERFKREKGRLDIVADVPCPDEHGWQRFDDEYTR